MDPVIHGLHHVTATVGGAQEDLDFYRKLLGLRLVKKTVNFDNPSVYHFYYGNERGTPGTLMTTFPYHGWGVPGGTHGAGQVQTTSFSVPEGSLGFWRARLDAKGVRHRDEEDWGRAALRFLDPSGLQIRLVEDAADPRRPWTTDEVGEAVAIRGLHAVSMPIRAPERSLALLTGLLGFTVVDEAEGRTRLAVGQDGAGRALEVLHAPEALPGVNGIGTVHHVAMAIADADEQLRIREELVRAGLHVTEVRDRQYFRSIYFREPGGVLYEIATIPPGFTVDEGLAELGCGLMLPPWEEPRRSEIAASLADVSH